MSPEKKISHSFAPSPVKTAQKSPRGDPKKVDEQKLDELDQSQDEIVPRQNIPKAHEMDVNNEIAY